MKYEMEMKLEIKLGNSEPEFQSICIYPIEVVLMEIPVPHKA